MNGLVVCQNGCLPCREWDPCWDWTGVLSIFFCQCVNIFVELAFCAFFVSMALNPFSGWHDSHILDFVMGLREGLIKGGIEELAVTGVLELIHGL